MSRHIRVETRSRHQNDIKRVMNHTAKVRRWEKKWVNVEETSMKSFRWMPIEDEGVLTDSQPTRSKLMRTDDGIRSEHSAPALTMHANRLAESMTPIKSPRNLNSMEDSLDIARIVTDQIVTRVASNYDGVQMEC